MLKNVFMSNYVKTKLFGEIIRFKLHSTIPLVIALLAIHSSTFAQTERTIYDVQTLKLDESTVDNVISFKKIVPHLNGIANLRDYVLKHQEEFPMEQKAIETSRDKKHEAHKRWERYMRKLPVFVLMANDINDYISVETTISKNISVCRKFTDELFVRIKNKNNFRINAEIEFEQNKLINFPKNKKSVVLLSDKKKGAFFNYVNNGKSTFSLPPNSEIFVKIPIVYNCNGKNNNTIENSTIEVNHKINLGGYVYNKFKKELYRVTSKYIKTSTINITSNK